MPKYFTAGLTQYLLSNFSKKSPPYHVTADEVSTPLQRLVVETIARHQSAGGRGDIIVVMYETHWTGLSRPSWEREMDVQLSRHARLHCRAGTPNQHRHTKRLYRRMKIGEAQREFLRVTASGCSHPAMAAYCTPTGFADTVYCNTVLPNGARVWY